MRFSENARKLKQSATFAVNNKRMEMMQQGIDVVNFGVGEPDFDTPESIKQACISALKEGHTRYTAISGIPQLRQAIAQKLKRDNQLDYEPSQIVVTNGARQAIANAITAVVDPGDEVMVVTPGWISYQQLILLNGGTPVLVPVSRENDYNPTEEALEALVNEKTKMLVMTTPSNPTGRVLSKETLEMIGDFAVRHDLYLLADEIYEKIVFDEDARHISIASLGREIYDRTITINGLSKSHAMTGWRMGYSASSPELAKVMTNIQNHYTAGINTMTQYASLEALNGSQDCVTEMVDEFRKRRDYIYENVRTIPGIHTVKPQGAFYLFIDLTDVLGKKYHGKEISNAVDFAQTLLEEKAVAMVACDDFGIENHIRASFATSMDNLIKGVKRLREFIQELHETTN